ncbi:MAG: glycosyltransferase [Solirubrobacterales bacterium]|nr:glycosyltransferase [Solirubrobacterales bacterium]
MGDTSGLRRHGRVALVHDFLLSLRGGERVFLALCDLFPEASVFSPVYNEAGTEGRFSERGVTTSYLQKLHPTSSNFRGLLPFYPGAVESLDMSEFDLIVSSSSAWSHGVIAHEGQRHICYSHNPFRYAWDQRSDATNGRSFPVRKALESIMGRWRSWDRAVAREVDLYVANGELTRERLARSFGRSSSVLHPPVDVGRFRAGQPGERFVVLSELLPHKRIDVIVEACSELGLPLTVMGAGPDLRRLRGLAGESVEFTGRVEDPEVADRLSSCAALIQCATEEFGIASVEAQASGRPVLALGTGGALETVIPGTSGSLFPSPDVETLMGALKSFDPGSFDPVACRASAERFSKGAFAVGLSNAVDSLDGVPTAPRERQSLRRNGLWRSVAA